MDFLVGNRWRIEAHWSFYTRLSHIIHLKVVSRAIKSRPWDRFPSDTWLPLDMVFVPFGTVVIFFFSASFLLGWNFHYPTDTERLLWHVFSVYHGVFVIYGGVYYLIEAIKWTKRRQAQALASEDSSVRKTTSNEGVELDPGPEDGTNPEEQRRSNGGWLKRFRAKISLWRNISVDQDPQMAVPLRVIVPVSVTCVLYIFCRLFLYIEDFVSLRSQPVGIYLTVNRFIPFLGSG